jgi:hypothetical protein
MWSAVGSQTSMGGRLRGAKMTRGGGRRTSRASTGARSASAPPGRQAPGRRPACDAIDIDGDSEGDSEAQPTGTKEATYALVSVLSHALQDTETLGHDLQDAAAAGDQELVQGLREASAWQRHLASQAQAVLQQRLHSGEGRVWHPDATICNLILMPEPDHCLL